MKTPPLRRGRGRRWPRPPDLPFLFLLLPVLSVAGPAPVHVRVEFLGAGESGFVTLRTETTPLPDRPGGRIDSTWVAVQAFDGTLLSRTLVRVRTRIMHREERGASWRESREGFRWDRSLEGWLDAGDVTPGVPVPGVAAETGFGEEGLGLEANGEFRLILPLETCRRFLPAYGEMQRRGELRALAVFHLSPHYYFHVQGDCTGGDGDCSSAVFPVPQDTVRDAHQALGNGEGR